jgi:lipopolysaccharide/colanic/teichoic acid biosynthesis glycosyltransferase
MYAKCFKRVLDFVLSLCALLVLSPVLLVMTVLGAVKMKGNPFFFQLRPGKDEKIFKMVKFRTMTCETDVYGALLPDEKRLTGYGKVLRSTSLDELPELFNILVGDMSIVGPRPERAFFYDQFETYIHGFRNRLAVQPGLTGLAQVNGGYDLAPEEKIVYDMDYIAKRSVLLDLKCILKTVQLLFTHKGAR